MNLIQGNNGLNGVVGLTGGIGAGKSVVSRILRCNGYPVYDCDTEAKKLMVKNPCLKYQITDCIGIEAYLPDGSLNKRLLSSLIFSDNRIRDKINGLVHAAVRQDILAKIENKDAYRPFFIESAILSTGKLDDLCEEIWVIDAPEKIRIKRIEKRDRMDKSEIMKRIHSQQKEIQNLPFPKIFSIVNDGDSALLKPILEKLQILN